MATVHATVQSAADFWDQIVVPDFNDSKDQPADLRKAFHCAISLFHMCDWIFMSDEAQVCHLFTYKDPQGTTCPVTNEKTFAKALRDLCGEFELIRRIANSAKHLALRSVGNHPHSPSHAANTQVRSTGWGSGSFSAGPFGGTPRVMLQGVGTNLEFSKIAATVLSMWKQLGAQHGWPLT